MAGISFEWAQVIPVSVGAAIGVLLFYLGFILGDTPSMKKRRHKQLQINHKAGHSCFHGDNCRKIADKE